MKYVKHISLLLFSLFVLNCSTNTPPPPGILRIRIPSDLTTLDPRKSSDFVSATMICLLYEGLTRCLSDGSVALGVADNVDISEDGKRYVFHLRKSVWNDGVPVTAKDFESTWKQILNPKNPAVCAYLFYPILNAESVVCGTKSVDEVGIRAIDDSTLEVLLERKTPHFLSLTSFPSFLPIPQHKLEKLECPMPLCPLQWVSNGPFQLDQIKSQSSIFFRKNPTFWNAEEIQLQGIAVLIIPNDTTALEMFQRRELDWLGGQLSGIPPDAFFSLYDQMQFSPIAASTFCTFNTEKSPFSNQNIRKAFHFATDKEKIARELIPMAQILATRYIPPALCGGKDRVLFPSFNPQLAKESLQKGLLEIQEPIESVTLHYKAGGIEGKLALVLKEMWEKTLQLPIKLVQMDGKSHKDCLHRRNYEIAISFWIAQYQDPMNILERFKVRSNAKNYCAWEDPEYGTLLQKAADALDPLTRMEFLEKAEQLLADQIPMIPLFHWSNPSLSQPRLQNMHTSPCGGPLFEQCGLSN